MTAGDQLIGRAFVAGVPVPQGDLSAAPARGGQRFGRLYHANAERLKPWRKLVGWQAKNQCRECFLGGDAPLLLVVRFVFPRPKKLAGVLAISAREATKRADIDKLARAVLDALTGVWFADDAQVVELVASKRLAERGENAGVGLELWQIREPGDPIYSRAKTRQPWEVELPATEPPPF